MQSDAWPRLVQLHQYAKELMLLGEELNKKFLTFIQPIQEQKHALEHIIRARAAELGIIEDSNESYIVQNYQKAIGHEYRCFFDLADWVSIHIRRKILDEMKKFSRECVVDVYPEFYHRIWPRINEINIKIAEIRKNKDVEREDDLIPEVENYRSQIDELIKMWNDILIHIPQLAQCKKQSRWAKWKNILWTLILLVLAGLAGATATNYWTTIEGWFAAIP